MEADERLSMRTRVVVRVPATTANLGPGFDCLGMAVDIWNELTVEKAEKQELIVIGEGTSVLPCDDSNLVIVGMKAAFKVKQEISFSHGNNAQLIHRISQLLENKQYSLDLPPFRFICVNNIPFARGMGSSSAAVVSGLVAGLFLLKVDLPHEAILNFASAIEGHSDNVAAAIYGGLQIGVKCVDKHNISKWTASQVHLPHGLQCVLFLPDHITETAASRAVLPQTVSREDAVFNISRIALLVNALSSGDLSSLGVAMDDRLHQPHRAKQCAHLEPLIAAATEAGALCACLSGSGPAVLALTCREKGEILSENQLRDVKVSDALLAAARRNGVNGRVFITHPSFQGAHVVASNPLEKRGDVVYFKGFCNK